MRHLSLGITTGLTAFSIVVPLMHLVVALAATVGIVIAPWDNPVKVFLFLLGASAFGAIPWGMWLALGDARARDMFDEDHEVVEYVLGGLIVFLLLTFLVCTKLQFFYAEFRWIISPILLACGAGLIVWRWRNVWGFPLRGCLNNALPVVKERAEN